jgi:hypothetical protein
MYLKCLNKTIKEIMELKGYTFKPEKRKDPCGICALGSIVECNAEGTRPYEEGCILHRYIQKLKGGEKEE